jgi:hypothetical protein
VAFAPLNTIQSGYHEKGTLAKDGAYIAAYGPKGAEELDKVANALRVKPYSWIVNNTTDKPLQTLSALLRLRYLVGSWLDAHFDSDGSNRNGYVVSVSGSSPSAEGTAPKK